MPRSARGERRSAFRGAREEADACAARFASLGAGKGFLIRVKADRFTRESWMPLAGFLGPFDALTLRAVQPGPAAANFDASGGAGSSRSLVRFSVEHQQQTNWCWAAVST